MPLTAADIRRRVLTRLGVTAAGEEASADDASMVDAAVSAVHDQLAGKGLTTNGSNTWTVERIPDYVGSAYVALVASEVADDFGISDGKAQRLLAQAKEAEREIRRQIAVPYNPDATMTDYEDTGLTWSEIG